MQIMPTTSLTTPTLAEQYFAGMNYGGDFGESFADELARHQDARNAVASGESHSVEAALDSSPTVTPLDQAPYNLTSDNGVTYTTEEVIFTQNELQELEKDLRAQGAPEETLEELKKLTEQPGGSTLGEVLAAVQNVRQYPSLSEDETKALQSLANKIDPSGQLHGTILGKLNAKDGKGALEALVQGMNLQEGKQVSFDKNEMTVLTKALGLSEKSSEQLLNSFGNGQSVKLNQEQLKSFLAPAFNDFSMEKTNKEQLDKALDATLGEIMQKAKDRMEKEKSASELSSRKVEQSKTVIEKTVLENVNTNLENARSSQTGKEVQNDHSLTEQAVKSEKTEKSSQTHAEKVIEKSDLPIQNDKLNTNTTDKNSESLKDLQHDANFAHGENLGENGAENNDAQNNNDAWGQLFQRAEVRTENTAAQSNKSVNTPILGIGGLANTAAQTAQKAALSQAQASRHAMSQQAAAQVEKAMLTAAKDGSKSLELQLHPAELGNLTITLTARNGEVSAMIRSERTETAEMLNKQLEQLRTQLENQGIKIDKLEVQSGTQENASTYDKWDGMQQHNQRQEENARREMLERMRNLGTIRNTGTNLENSTLERNMQNEHYTAGNATQSLYIVA